MLLVLSNDDVLWVFNLQDIDLDDLDMCLFFSMGVGVDGVVKYVSKKKIREGYWFNNQYLERVFYKKNCCGFFNN